jgi:hypothetical protein
MLEYAPSSWRGLVGLELGDFLARTPQGTLV